MENDFGAFLRDKRIEKNMTQKELAKELFVSESAVSKWEKNVARPDISLLPKLSELLDASEHELITASVDHKARDEKRQAKRWRALSLTWHISFYIAYGIALLVCFICNIAVNKTLSWFFIVFASIVLAFSFTNLPKFIKKHRLLFIPLSEYLSLCLLLAVIAIYTGGGWFFIAAFSVLLGLMAIFVPIYIAKFDAFKRFRKYNDFVSVFICFLMLNILLLTIFVYTLRHGYAERAWYFTIALPITAVVYLTINTFISVRLLRINGFLKTGLILFMITLIYIFAPLISLKGPTLYAELDSMNIFLADLSNWQDNVMLSRNINLIIILSFTLLIAVFTLIGALIHCRNKKGEREYE